MITNISGNLLDSYCQAIVNPVNCVGVMGAGIALQLKLLAPDNFREYCRACKENLLAPGHCLVVPTDEVSESIQYIINLPTKQHWKEPSRIEFIISGLTDMVKKMNDWGIDSVAIPSLGCGCGRLEWKDVKTTIIRTLCDLGCDEDENKIYALYEPFKKDK